MQRPALKPGLYRHFKGGVYEVIGVAELVDADRLFVVYRPKYGEQELVLRPYEEFVSTVDRDGEVKPRFRLVEETPTVAHASWESSGL